MVVSVTDTILVDTDSYREEHHHTAIKFEFDTRQSLCMLTYSRLRSLSVRVCVDFSYFLTIIIFKNIWFNRRENYLSSQKIKRLVVLFAVSWEVSPQGIQKQFAGSRYCWEALLFLFSYSLLLYSTGRRQNPGKGSHNSVKQRKQPNHERADLGSDQRHSKSMD